MSKKPSKVPEKVKIGGYIYTIINQPESFFTTGEAYGSTCLKTRTINLWDGQPPSCYGDTLVHELIHTLNDLMDIDDGAKEEDIARRVGSALWAAIVDNPDLFKYLSDLAKKSHSDQ